MHRYGQPIIVLNLVKSVEKQPRESLLCREFSRAIGYVNKQVESEGFSSFWLRSCLHLPFLGCLQPPVDCDVTCNAHLGTPTPAVLLCYCCQPGRS